MAVTGKAVNQILLCTAFLGGTPRFLYVSVPLSSCKEELNSHEQGLADTQNAVLNTRIQGTIVHDVTTEVPQASAPLYTTC